MAGAIGYTTVSSRVKTYKNWIYSDVVSPHKLAEAGFYYTQQDDKVRCAFCKLYIYNWDFGDIPKIEHRERRPQCPFVLSKFKYSNDIINNEYTTFKSRLDTFKNWSDSDIVSPHKLAAAGFYYTQRGDKVRCAFCNIYIYNWDFGDIPKEEHRERRPQCPFVLSNFKYPNDIILPDSSVQRARKHGNRNNLLDNEYTTFKSRLETYKYWPKTNVVTPHKLAEAGFYYTQQADEVCCAFCNINIYYWYFGLIPKEKHREHNPQCPFVLSNLKHLYGNALPDSSVQRARKHENRDNLMDNKYTSFKSRLDTYKNWPNSDIVSPHKLAEAGFYYTQRGDKVRCAFCNIYIYNWDFGDIPKKEHRERRPQCPFVLSKFKYLNDNALPDSSVQRARKHENTTNSSATSIVELKSKIETVLKEVQDMKLKSETEPKTDLGSRPKERVLEEKIDELESAKACKICLDKDSTMLFMPCRHMVSCADCASKLENCPVCRCSLTNKISVILS